jgi:hypothetical protein
MRKSPKKKIYNLKYYSAAMFVLLIFKIPLIKNWTRQWKVVKTASQDISGRHEMKLRASELCHYYVL